MKHILSFAVVLAIVVLHSGRVVSGQDTIPSTVYYAAFQPFYDGDYATALDRYQSALRGGTKIGPARWVDSICYHTMIGECYYRMGRYPEALDQYSAALHLQLSYSDWLARLQWSSAIRPVARAGTPWGDSSRSVQIGQYPKNAGYRIDKLGFISQGSDTKMMQQHEMRLVQAEEIVRCIGLSIRRRAEILGPLSKYDPLTNDVLAAMEQSPGLPNHWSQAWVDSLHGLALVAAGKPADALPLLQRGTAAMGQFDHVLTSAVLLELGRLALDAGDYERATPLFHEASVSAFYNFDGSTLEDALELAGVSHLAARRKGLYPPLPPAVAWARLNKYRTIAVSLALLTAESHLMAGETSKAVALLNEANASMGRLAMRSGMYSARLDYLRAMAAYQSRNLVEGDAALTAALTQLTRCSLWVFQIQLLEARYLAGDITTSGPITMRAAMELYTTLLREPTAIDWASRPMDALTVLKTPNGPAYEHWFLIAMDRNDHEKAFEIADRARRHRFHNTMGFGGRMLSLRKILEAPENELESSELLKRRDLFTRYPAYAELSRRAAAARTQLEAMPLVPDNEVAGRTMAAGLAQWNALSREQEAMLREVAVRREDVPLLFPPLRSMNDIRQSLPPNQALLIFFCVGQDTYAYLLNAQDYDMWRVRSTAAVRRLTGEFLRALGHYDPNKELTLQDLAGEAWKAKSAELLNAIMSGSRADFTTDFPQLVIVPDGVLWYVPFESLHVQVDGRPRPLISRFAVRYAPTASLAVPGPRTGRPLTVETLVGLGKLHPRDDVSVAQEAFSAMKEAMPRLTALQLATLPGPTSVYLSLVKQMVVFDDIPPAGRGLYSWSPLPIEPGKPGNQLGDWLTLPWGGPRLIVLPGFHTTAEDGLRRASANDPGREVFLDVCALMAGGADTVLLARWRPGGQSSYDLVHEFLKFYPNHDAADAWRKAIYAVAAQKIQVDREPRIRGTSRDDVPMANHPFFWAHLMLIDRGQSTVDDDPEMPDDEEPGEDGAAGADDPDPAAGDEAKDPPVGAGDPAIQFDPIDGSIIPPSAEPVEPEADATDTEAIEMGPAPELPASESIRQEQSAKNGQPPAPEAL